MQKTISSVLQNIGQTPLVALDRITEKVSGRILAKLEHLNPGASKKDRAALQIIQDAEASGALQRGQTVVELTSGNMGAGLAIVCAQKGYRFVAVMSRGNSVERAQMMRAFGAEVVLVDQAPGSVPGSVSGKDLQLVDIEAETIVKETGAFRVDQFSNLGNFRAHYLNTGPEIWEQSDGKIDAFCDFVGTGGSFAGIAKYLKEQSNNVGCYVIEPAGAAALAGKLVKQTSHPIQGGGYVREKLDLIDPANIDGFVEVTGEQAKEAARRLALKEGIFAGFSAGANLAAAMQFLTGPLRGRTIAIIICDSGLKYMSTDLWA